MNLWLPRAGRRSRPAGGAENRGDYRPERSAETGFGSAHRAVAHPRSPHRNADRRRPGDGRDRFARDRPGGRCLSARANTRRGASRGFRVFAGVLPEGKFNLVKAFQKSGHAVGMCGDGANDAPALRQAQMGIAVSMATDVAKSAAGIVLTKPGLSGIVASVREGRVTFQRILTYTLNSINKNIAQLFFLAVGLVMTGHAILTPMLMVIIMLTGDILGMSLTTDNVRPSQSPNVWRIGALTIAGVFMGVCELIFSHSRPGPRQVPPGFWNRDVKDGGVRSHRIRKSSHHLYESRTPAHGVLPSQPLTRRVVHGGPADRRDAGHLRNRDGSSANTRRGGNARGGSGLRIHRGLCKSALL